MKAIVFACVAVFASVADANIIDNVVGLWNSLPATKADALNKYGRAKIPPLNATHRQALKEAHTNIQVQRKRLGLPPMGGHSLVGAQDGYETYELYDGFNGSILGFIKGLQYN